MSLDRFYPLLRGSNLTVYENAHSIDEVVAFMDSRVHELCGDLDEPIEELPLMEPRNNWPKDNDENDIPPAMAEIAEHIGRRLAHMQEKFIELTNDLPPIDPPFKPSSGYSINPVPEEYLGAQLTPPGMSFSMPPTLDKSPAVNEDEFIRSPIPPAPLGSIPSTDYRKVRQQLRLSQRESEAMLGSLEKHKRRHRKTNLQKEWMRDRKVMANDLLYV